MTPHARAEELLVYPAFAASTDDVRMPVAEGYDEHALVHQLCAEIKGLDVGATWRAKAKVLMDLVEHHVKQEEGEQFTEARRGLDADQALQRGADFVAKQAELSSELGLPAPETLDLPPAEQRKPAKA